MKIIDYFILNEAIGYQLRRAQIAVFQDFSEIFTAEGLRPADFSVILIISRNPGLKQSEIAEALGIQRANFVAIADGLECRGLAERRRSEADRRVQALFLTEKGEEFAENMLATWRIHEKKLLDAIGGEEERHKLTTLLVKLTNALAK